MNNPGKQQSVSDREVDDHQQSNDDSSPVSSGTGATISEDSPTRRNGNDIGLAARLTEMFAGDGDRDSDLLMQRNTQEGTVVQWLQALDMQVIGACRADERLKPLLKLNVSSVAEDRLLSHLSQHFEPSEVGLLARCLCIPLVSIRVGKINKQGTRLIPTSARGNLVLSLLPTSDLRISFLGDDGYTQRLSILRNTSDCSYVVIKPIPSDTSGRSFSIKVPNSTQPFHFWCSEKSKLLGNELLEKMRNLLERKPSLAELTGISNSRLDRFVHHLRTFLVGSTTTDQSQTSKSPFSSSKPTRIKTCTIQSSLSPRPSSFKEVNLPRTLASLRNIVRDKSRREKHPLPSFDHPSCYPSLTKNMQIPVVNINNIPSPNYCWCPPVVQYMVTQPITTTTTQLLTLPPLSPSPSLSDIPPFLPSSQQIPILHIPVIDICSSGQAYLVSTGPPIMSLTIPPLVQECDSEKSARDTLRILLSGASHADGTHTVLGSRGFYGATTDVNVNVDDIAAMSLVSPMRRRIDQGDLVHLLKEPIDNDDNLSEGSIE